MALNPSNSSNLEHLALKGLKESVISRYSLSHSFALLTCVTVN